ncbi:MAG: hypothetical protein HYX38_31990 [Rhodospirillales bacterium]|nr:hypothetical protein [Rhodospirillales bacterium]
MSITVTVNLSDALTGFGGGTGVLNQAGVYAYAVYFQDGTANWTTLADGSGSTPASSTDITIQTPYTSGKIYFLVQSGSGNDLTTLITQESQLNWTNAQTWDFRFDSVELTVKGNSNDVANLTDVNGFGLPMSISNGLSTNGSRGYAQSGAAMFGDIENASTTPSAQTTATLQYNAGPLNGDQRMMFSPAEALSQGSDAFKYTDWSQYVTSLQAVASNVKISGWFNGAPDANNVWHDAGYYSYQLSFEGGYFWLSPSGNSQIKGYIRIAPDQLANSIYATLGTADVFLNKTDATPYLANMNVGANNQWGEVFTNLLTGFTGGYYGETGKSPNASITTGIDLYNSANWDPTYAFGSNLAQANPLAGATWDKYAELFFQQTNSYGAGYSDNLTKALSVGPLMTLWNNNSQVNTPLTITLYADSDTPSTAEFQGALLGSMGLTEQVIYNYPGASNIGGATSFQSGNSFTFNFGGSNVFLDTHSTLKFGFSPDGTLANFVYVDVPTTATSFWNTYTLINTGGAYSFSPATNPSTPGSIGITGLPVAAAGTWGWYQMVVTGPPTTDGSKPWSKTFNLYAEADGSGLFLNPNYTGANQANALQGDGLVVAQAQATPNPPQSVSGVTWAFLTSAGYGLDSSVLKRNATTESIANSGDATYTPPFAPVVGSVNGSGAFTNYMKTPGVYTVGPTPNAYQVDSFGRVNPTSVIAQQTPVFPDGAQYTNNLVTYTLADEVTKAKIAFSWWAADSQWVATNANQDAVLDHGLTSDIIWDGSAGSVSRWNPANLSTGYVQGQYTNKVGALNVAMIDFVLSDASGTYTKHAPITVTADLDGVWATKNTLFVDGTYKAVLMEYAPDDKQFTTPLNKASDGIVFTIDGTSGGGSISGGDGSGISYNGGGDGAWVRLDSTTSTLPNGTLFVYFTDSSGKLLDRSDSVTTSLHDAIRGEIGLVKTDGGASMFNGTQSIYLPTGMVMKFAIQVGNGDIKALPDIQVSGTGTLSVSVSDPSGVLNLSAVIDTSPGPNTALALTQHEFDRAWVYLTKGESVQVDVAGSAYNNNTLHFVHIDTDPSDPANSAGWTVGGVAWGNTDAFRAAVQANWETGYSASGGRGNFQDTQSFTASKAGYYAPVLTTEGGDTFVIGATANVDGREHIRVYGQSNFGFEDTKGGDWDYNDLVMKITVT